MSDNALNRNLYRQLFLFLVAVILPSLAIVKLGSMVVANYAKEVDRHKEEIQRQKEDGQRQEQEARRQKIVGIGLAVVDRLDLLGASAAAGGASTGPVVFVGQVDSHGLKLPWDDNAVVPSPTPAERGPELLRLLATLRRNENREDAARNYGAALQSALDDAQRGEVWLLMSQFLTAPGDAAKAQDVYRKLLDLPSNVVSTRDVEPFASFGAKGLMKTHATDHAIESEIVVRAARDLDTPAVLVKSIAAWRPILEDLRKSGDASIAPRAADLLGRMTARVRYVEQVTQLKAAYPALGIDKPGVWLLWRQHGEGQEDWFVGTVAGSKLVAIRAADVLAGVESGAGSDFHIGDEGELLSSRLPGLRVAVAGGGGSGRTAAATVLPESRPWASPELLLRASIVFITGLSLFAGYLLWRNTRREVRIAEMRSQFVSSVSHELRTPLTSIRMFAELLQLRDPDNPVDAKTHGEYLDMIVNESERLTRLLNNVLDFSRIEHGQKSYRMETTRLDEVVIAAARTMEYPLAQQGFDLRVQMDGVVAPVEADRDALKQAILNLLTNAMKYSGKSRNIELRLAPDAGGAVIQVQDHGIGIPIGEQPHIFKKFYRARVPENGAIAGTGLGLALVTHIAEAHGGSVDVESAPGMGSTFSIHLPLRAEGHS